MPSQDRDLPVVLPLAAGTASADLVGGKAARLGEMLRTGLSVPDGFCVTTAAYPVGASPVSPAADDASDEPLRCTQWAEDLRQTILSTPVPADLRAAVTEAYARLGGGRPVPVAVRSSATAEDLPHASFAGQQDSFLDVTGAEAVVEAVRRCWASLWTERAVRYRAVHGLDHHELSLAVIVQHMAQADSAGVLFTADPVSGCRTRMVVEAGRGPGEAVVSGTVIPDRYVLDASGTAPLRYDGDDGCLSSAHLAELAALGRRLQRHFGAPQDVEWVIDRDGTVWITQSRPISTLYPVPETERPGLRMYYSFNAMQGVLQPITPMGRSVLRMFAASFLRSFGFTSVDPFAGPPGFVDAGGRLYFDITEVLRTPLGRRNLLRQMRMVEPRAGAALERALADPRYAPQGRPSAHARTLARIAARFALPGAVGAARAVLRPDAARARAYRLAARIGQVGGMKESLTPEQRLDLVERLPRRILDARAFSVIRVVYGGMLATVSAMKLLGDRAAPDEVATVLRGMPHNVTNEMGLALWRLAQHVRADDAGRDAVMTTAPAELVRRYRQGALPAVVQDGMHAFLARYGCRAVAEIDVGVPRWSEDPGPVFAMLVNCLRATDDERAADCQHARAAAEAEAMIDELAERLRPRYPVRARLSGLLLRRARAVSGLRELPKFSFLPGCARIREELLRVGAALMGQGRLDRVEDIMFLDLYEARAALRGRDVRLLVAQRRASHERELRRRYVPVLFCSDGTDLEAAGSNDGDLAAAAAVGTAAAAQAGAGVLRGVPAAPGRVTGTARVVVEPAEAVLEPGEILVAPSTDPGWTPLFLTAQGLVTEAGGPNGHGATVAREFGIPAVVGVSGATQVIRTGQRIVLDASAGIVELLEPAEPERPADPAEFRL